MTTTMIPVLFKINDGRLVQTLQEVAEKLDGANGEVILDFASVRRVDPGELKAMDKLVSVAEEKGVRVVLRGTNVDVYKVLKLARLGPRFSFVA